MSWISIILTMLIILLTAGAGWLLHTASRQRPSTELTWFRLLPVGSTLWGESKSMRVDRARLFGGLGLGDDAHEPRLGQATLADRHKELFGSNQESTMLGVPATTASKVAHAAAGCGIIAVPCDASLHDNLSSPVPESFHVHPGTPWKLGLSAQGQPLTLHPVPGVTIAALGNEAQITNIMKGFNWPEQVSSVLHTTDDSHDATRRWREAWNPSATRIVTRTCAQEQLDWASERMEAIVSTDARESISGDLCDRLLPGIIADVIILLRGHDHHGLVLHRDHRQTFTPFTYRSTSSSLRTARVASARAASSSSAG